MQKVLDYISEHGQITENEVQVPLKIKKKRAVTLLKQLREMNLVFTEGRGKGKRYVAK